MRSLAVLLGATLLAASLRLVNAQSCNCPWVSGECGVNCSSVSQCCGGGTLEPSCLTPGNQCCIWSIPGDQYKAATQCTDTETCCGEASTSGPSAFCCSQGSSCCPTNDAGFSTCCGPTQQCCGGGDTFCCDAETEMCGPPNSMVCLPATPITFNPRAKPGKLEWAANLNYTENPMALVALSKDVVVASGGAGTALVRLGDGAATFILPPALEEPAVVDGRLIVITSTELVAYDLGTSSQAWAMNFSTGYAGVVGSGKVFLAANATSSTLNGYDAPTGALLYSIAYADAPYKPVLSPHGTAAFLSEGVFAIFVVESGAVLVNTTVPCSYPAPVLVGSTFVACNFVAYGADNGVQLWSVSSSPLQSLIATSEAVVGVATDSIYFVAPSNGKVIQKVPLTANTDGSVLTVAGSAVIFANNNLTAYNATSGVLLWHEVSASYVFQFSGGASKEVLYVPATSDAHPYVMVMVNQTTGHVAGSAGLGGIPSSPLFVGDRVLFTADDGFLYCLRAL